MRCSAAAKYSDRNEIVTGQSPPTAIKLNSFSMISFWVMKVHLVENSCVPCDASLNIYNSCIANPIKEKRKIYLML